MISVVTPTYNRAYILPQLYKSLIKNKKTHSDFEWVIMDDGSSDDTDTLIKKWQKENKITIKYYKQKNQGKMAALNNVMSKTKGDLIIEVDSDDYLTDNAFKTIMKYWDKVKNNEKLYGALFRRSFEDKELDSKNQFPFTNKISTMFDLYMKEGFDKDSVIVFKGDIRRKYKHKLEHNEKFITEARMYNELDTDYEGLLCINEPLVVCEYLEDGYSKNIEKLFKNNPYGYRLYFKECLNMDLKNLPKEKRLYFIKHYILFSYMTYTSMFKTIKDTPGLLNLLLVITLIIPGYIASKRRFGRSK